MRRLTVEEIQDRLALKGISLVKYAGTIRGVSKFKCNNGHEWLAVGREVISSGGGCGKCYEERSHSSHEDVGKRLEGRGIKCVAYGGSMRSVSTFECGEGHIWSAITSNVVSKTGCPECRKYTVEKINKRLSNRGIQCLSYAGSVKGDSEFKCKNGHKWTTTLKIILQDKGCPQCAAMGASSREENEVADFLSELGEHTIRNSRGVIPPLELDIVVPERRVAIEFNGVYWHSEKAGVSKNYHINKRLRCEDAGFRLISVRSDLWRDKKEIIKRIITNALGTSCGRQRIGARNCNIISVDKKTAWQFCDDNHVQGGAKSTYAYGLEYNGEIIAVLTVLYWRKKKEWELVRFCTSCVVQGGLSRLWKHATETLGIEKAYTYTDRDLFTGGAYASAGFKFKSTTVGFRITDGTNTESRQKWGKAPDGLTQTEWYEREKVSRIWDSGQDKWEWVKGA